MHSYSPLRQRAPLAQSGLDRQAELVRLLCVSLAALMVLGLLGREAALGLTSPMPPQLRVIKVDHSDTSVGPVIGFTVRNVGDRRARPSVVRVYLSADAAVSADDKKVLTFRLPRIAGHRQAGRVTDDDWGMDPRLQLVCVTARGQHQHCSH